MNKVSVDERAALVAGPSPRPVARSWTSALFAAFSVVTTARIVTSRGRDEYAIWPDEPSQLAVARFIGGGTRWNMYDHSVWRPLFGTLLAPVYWFTDDPTTVFHVALALNAVLGGVAAALLVPLARRLTPLSPWWCCAVAVSVSVAPAAIFPTSFVFSESLLVPIYLATLLVLFAVNESPSLGRGLLAGVLAAAGFATHSRMLPLVAIVIGVVLLAAVRRRISARDAVVVVAGTLGATAVVSMYTSYVVDRLWSEPSTRNSMGGVLEQLRSGWPVLVSALGQTWYLLVASLGVIAYGVFVLVRAAFGRSLLAGPRAGDARLLLVTTGVCISLSMVFMADRWRSDQLVYGRYNDAVVGPVLVVGIAVLLGAIPVRRLVAIVGSAALAILGTGSILWALRSTELSASNGLEPMILGLQSFATSATSIEVIRISWWAAVLTIAVGAIAVAATRRAMPAVVLVVLIALVGLGWVRTKTILDRSWDDSGDISAVEDLRDGPLNDGVAVDFYLPWGSTSTNRMMAYQFHLPRTEFTVVHDQVDDASSPLVFARVRDDGFDEVGATLIWRDPRGRYGLWER